MNTCSLAELLSLVMTGGESASRMSKLGGRALREYGSRSVANERDPHRLSEALDIPITRARQITAMFEIGRRFFSSSDQHAVLLRGPEDVASYAVGMADLRCEQFRVLCINEQHHLIAEELLATGSECSASLHPRDALRPALLHRAAALAFVHNHPSGDPAPSASDIEITRQICRAAEYAGIRILDHVIVSPNGWFSMGNENLLS